MKNILKRLMIVLFGKEILLARYDFKTQVMTIDYTNDTTEQFKGSGTVWHEMPLMKRCNTFDEGTLCEIWEYITQWGNPYPIAHQKCEPQIAKRHE